jgi:dihydroorotate dehydrogenase (NAD+) catalytic subunit
MTINLKVNIAGIEMKNPILTASGTYGFGEEYLDFYPPEILGAVVTKTIRLHEHPGNPTPRVAEAPAGLINAVGIPSKGLDYFIKYDVERLKKLNIPIIQSIVGETFDDYIVLTEKLSELNFLAAIELNLSCPNLGAGGLDLGLDPEAVYKFIKDIRKRTSLPLIAKLTPNTSDIVGLAKSVEAGGADCISMINTLKAMAIDINKRKPILANISGGLSGPAIKPVALYQIWQVYKSVKIPIIGMGGVSNYEDVIEFMLAGSSAVALGTVNFIDPNAAVTILADIEDYLARNNIKDINELVGAAHPYKTI